MKKTYLSILSLLVATTLSAQTWETLADVPEDLAFPLVVSLDGNIHVMGGGGPGGASTLHLRYMPSTDTWDTLAAVPYAAQQPGGAVVNGKIHYCGGGFPNTGTPLTDHHVYDPGTDSWDTAAVIPATRAIHEAVGIGNEMYVMGGQPDKLRFEVYNQGNNTWTSKNNLPDQSFWYGAITEANGTIFRFAGGGYTAPTDAAHTYNASNDSWTSLPDLPEAVHAVSAASIGDSIYLVGGYYDFAETDEVWIYDINTQQYRTGPAMPSGRSYHSVVSIGECIYSVGGNNAVINDMGYSLIRLCVNDTVDSAIGIQPLPEIEPAFAYYRDGMVCIKLDHGNTKMNLQLMDLRGNLISEHITDLNQGKASFEVTDGSVRGCYVVRLEYDDVEQFTKVLIWP